MTRPIRLEIHTSALLHNLKTLRQFAQNRFMWVVLKADAYGHRMKDIIRYIENADGGAVIGPDDAVDLRNWGWKKPILLLEGFFEPKEIPSIVNTGSIPIISTIRQIEILENYASNLNLEVYIKVETGLNRLGFKPEAIPLVAKRINAIQGVRLTGMATHFANAEPSYPKSNVSSIYKQIEQFQKAKQTLPRICLANTAATIFYPSLFGNEVRVGIGLYGISPDASIPNNQINLQVTDFFYTKIISINSISSGDAVGYGSKFIANNPMNIAVIACGYADGYPRNVSCHNEQPYVYIRGKKARIIGTIAMDMMTVDISDLPEAQIGDDVELWGNNVKITDVANWAGTIPYDLMCSITARVPIFYI